MRASGALRSEDAAHFAVTLENNRDELRVSLPVL